jgi:DNA-binding LacI/PurR family transcriptional regulator
VPKITVKDIAKSLNLSESTVSRALTGKGNISPETRRKVLEQAKKLRYYPNTAARSLTTMKTNTIAAIVRKKPLPLVSDPFYPFVFREIEHEAQRLGYSVLVSTIDEQIEKDPSPLKVLNDGIADGFILAGPDISPKFILFLKNQGIPLVLADNEIEFAGIDCVVADDLHGSCEATNYLIQKGYKNIIHITGPLEWNSFKKRAKGYEAAMKDNGLEDKISIVQEKWSDIEFGFAATKRVFEIENKNPEAIFAANDAMAIGAIKYLKSISKGVPTDVAVVGFDDIEWAKHNSPPLTTVHIYKEKIGELAARRLIEQIERPDEIGTKIVVETKLVIRESA